MDPLLEELGIPKKYLKPGNKDHEYIVLVHKSWLKSLVKDLEVVDFVQDRLEEWPELEQHTSWTKVYVRLFKKRDVKVLPLPRVRASGMKNDPPLLLCQLMQYVYQTNYKNLWKEAFKKHGPKGSNSRETQVTLVDYNSAFRDIISRVYNCPIINAFESSQTVKSQQSDNNHLNILPALACLETLNAFFLIHPNVEYNLRDCLTFSPAILDKSYSKPLFIVYQLLKVIKWLHDRSLTLGDVTVNDVYLGDDLWIRLIPDVSSNLVVKETQLLKDVGGDCVKSGHKLTNRKCDRCGVKSYDAVVAPPMHDLEAICKLWCEGRVSNFTYITALNQFSGRKLNDPNRHHVFPWVTDFASRDGKNWRDLKRSKFRLNKGDPQLDLTYESGQSEIAHHVSDVLSSITYYVYMARRTPRSVLCNNVRTVWVPAEYPNSIQRMQEWTPDECIPEFFTDPAVFRSIHDDLDDLEVPDWAASPEDFVERHREALESSHVSDRLHHWIDLTFGYKLSGAAAIKAKNVCLHLVDEHTNLTKSGLSQLFHQPHPTRNSQALSKLPPKKEQFDGSDEEETRSLSRTRYSLPDEMKARGVRNATFQSHLPPKIALPKDFRPELALDALEKRHNFLCRTFHTEQRRKCVVEPDEERPQEECEDTTVNAFTNLIYCDSVELKRRAIKSNTFPLDQNSVHLRSRRDTSRSDTGSTVTMCNYSGLITQRRMKELRVLGCMIVEVFMAKQIGVMHGSKVSYSERLRNCLTIASSCRNELPRCVAYIVELLLQPSNTLEVVTDLGLPQPSAHLLLEPLVSVVSFPRLFPKLYGLVASLYEYHEVSYELDLFYNVDCDGEQCEQFEQLELTKRQLGQNIAECMVKTFAKDLEALLDDVNPNTDSEIVYMLLPHVKALLEDDTTAVLTAWYLFDPVAKVLGLKTRSSLLEPILKLYDSNDVKLAKLYHHSFLLRLIVRLGLKCFLDNFTVALVEAVGGYKDCERDSIHHTHNVTESKRLIIDDSSDESGKEPEMFVMDEEKVDGPEEFDGDIKSLNHSSSADEALDATIIENLEHLRGLEELKINFDDELTSPTLTATNIIKISCDVGSKKSDTDSLLESPAEPKSTNNKNSRRFESSAQISDISSDSLIWLAHRLGPVLTARHLSRNLLKMLTLCYVGMENLTLDVDDTTLQPVSIIPSGVVGDESGAKVLDCLTAIAGLYGEQFILFQYIPHMSELIALCKKKMTLNLEGGLISCLVLLQRVIPFLTDATLMDQLQDVILKNILHPIVRLLGSTKFTFPCGQTARNVLARKYIDTLYILSIRIGSEMTRTHLAVPALQRFFLIFDKIRPNDNSRTTTETTPVHPPPDPEPVESTYVEYCRDGTVNEWFIGGKPLQISTVESFCDSLVLNEDGLDELVAVFTPELAYFCYLPFLKHIGAQSLDISLKNHESIRELCQEFETSNNTQTIRNTFSKNQSDTIPTSSSVGSNISVVGNRIECANEPDSLSDVLRLVSNRMEANNRHLRGNWLAYWEHEIGRSDKDTMFNFKQIKLQTFTGHVHSVKCLHVLDNENSFMSASRDKTVKLWSLRSQGDGSQQTNCQWTYTAHKKSILSVTFVESVRLVGSSDSVVHIWDPFMGVNVGHLEAAKYAPVNVLKSLPAPSTLLLAATTDGTIKLIDTRICNYIQELKVSFTPSGLIRCLSVPPSGTWIASGQSSGTITVLETRTGLVLSSWKAHEGEVLQLVAPDERTLISTGLDQTISVWNVDDGKFRFHLRGSTEPVHCLNLYNNKELISGTTANRIGVHTSIGLEACFSSTKLRADAFRGLLTSMAVLPLNRMLLLGADSGNIHLLC